MCWSSEPGPPGYAGTAMATQQIGKDLTSYLNGLNERIYMLEEQVRIQQRLLKNLNNRIKQISEGENSIHSAKSNAG